MRLSLLDWLGLGNDDAEKDADLPWPIELTHDIERGWPIYPADADTLTGAFNALGFLPPAATGGSRAPDHALTSAIERFQEAKGLAPSGSMGRGGMTILHLNKGAQARQARPCGAATRARPSAGDRERHCDVRGPGPRPPRARCAPEQAACPAPEQG